MVPLGAGDQCQGDGCQDINTGFPLEGTDLPCTGATASGGLSQDCGCCGTVLSMSSLATSDVSGWRVTECPTLPPTPWKGEVVSARLNGPLSGAGVDSAADLGVVPKWPDTGHTTLSLLRPDGFGAGKRLLSAFLCLFLGTGE